jgi:hypothetical protein
MGRRRRGMEGGSVERKEGGSRKEGRGRKEREEGGRVQGCLLPL